MYICVILFILFLLSPSGILPPSGTLPSPPTSRHEHAPPSACGTSGTGLSKWRGELEVGRLKGRGSSVSAPSRPPAPPPTPPQITLCAPRSGKDLERGATSFIWGRSIFPHRHTRQARLVCQHCVPHRHRRRSSQIHGLSVLSRGTAEDSKVFDLSLSRCALSA